MLTQEQEQFLKRLRETGAGNTMSEELMNMYIVGKTDDLSVPTRDGETHIYIHYPPSDRSAYPLFVNIHGGGFFRGHRQQDTVFAKNICSRAQCVVIDIDYTPAPDKRYPYALHQCYDVIRWAYDNSESLGINLAYTALCGHSAGGNIVAAITLLNQERHDFPIGLQILDYPLLDVHTPPHKKRNAEKDPGMVRSFQVLSSVFIDDDQRLEPTASPLFAPEAMLPGLPGALIITCGDDPLGEEGEKYACRLLEAGVPVTARRFLHSGHGFTVRRRDQFEDAETMILHTLGKLYAK